MFKMNSLVGKHPNASAFSYRRHLNAAFHWSLGQGLGAGTWGAVGLVEGGDRVLVRPPPHTWGCCRRHTGKGKGASGMVP